MRILAMNRVRTVSRTAAHALVAFVLFVAAAAAQEVNVAVSGGFTAAYLELVPEAERATGVKIVSVFGASMGGAPDSVPSRLDRGEPIDMVIIAGEALDALIDQGKIAAGSRVDLVRSEIGMVVRAGAPTPDISTVEALRRVLLQAESVAYSASASGTYLSTELFPQLGIVEQMKVTGQRIESERVATVVARGDAEIGFQQVSELLPAPGVTYVGPLPPDVQRVTIFSAGVAAAATDARAASRLIEFLASPAAHAAIRKSGLEPVQ